MLTVDFTSFNILVVAKAAILVFEALYSVFAFVVVRQVSHMNKSLSTPAKGSFRLASYIHLFSVLGLILLSLIILR